MIKNSTKPDPSPRLPFPTHRTLPTRRRAALATGTRSRRWCELDPHLGLPHGLQRGHRLSRLGLLRGLRIAIPGPGLDVGLCGRGHRCDWRWRVLVILLWWALGGLVARLGWAMLLLAKGKGCQGRYGNLAVVCVSMAAYHRFLCRNGGDSLFQRPCILPPLTDPVPAPVSEGADNLAQVVVELPTHLHITHNLLVLVVSIVQCL